MPYTAHGHWYGDTEPTPPPPAVARCGGPALCPDCALEAHRGEEGPTSVTASYSNPNVNLSYLTAGAGAAYNPTVTTYTITTPATPGIGARVHYVSEGSPVLADGTQRYPSLCRAAIVTQVAPGNPGLLGLCVLNPSGMFFNVAVPHDETRGPGTWHWPDHT